MATRPTFSKPLHKAVLPEGAYVVALAALPMSYAAASSEPTNRIYLFDKATLQPRVLKGHAKPITALCTVSSVGGSSRPTLLSSGKDSVVCGWDERTDSSAPSLQMRVNSQHELLCCDASPDGFTVAAGTDLRGPDALVVYWDPRNPAVPIRTHTETHSDDVTAVHFHPSSQAPLILSASSDGLLSISNPYEDDPDEAGQHVGSWGCSIAQAGWINGATNASQAIWAASDMETFTTWTMELDRLSDIDIRGPSYSPVTTWSTDYLVSARSTDRDSLLIFVGNNEGALALCKQLSDASSCDREHEQGPFAIQQTWSGGHAGVVRSTFCDEDVNILVTGGEDSNLCLWPLHRSKRMEQPMDVEAAMSGGDGSLKRGYHEIGRDDIGKRTRQ